MGDITNRCKGREDAEPADFILLLTVGLTHASKLKIHF